MVAGLEEIENLILQKSIGKLLNSLPNTPRRAMILAYDYGE
jgi:hypothetical protein